MQENQVLTVLRLTVPIITVSKRRNMLSKTSSQRYPIKNKNRISATKQYRKSNRNDSEQTRIENEERKTKGKNTKKYKIEKGQTNV